MQSNVTLPTVKVKGYMPLAFFILGGDMTQRRHHVPMSDTEFESRYDPQGYREKRIIALLEDIANSLSYLALPARPEPRQYDRPARPIQPKTGAIEL